MIWPREGWAMGMGAALLWLLDQLLLLLCAPVLAPAQGAGCVQVWRRKGWAVGTGAALLWLVM